MFQGSVLSFVLLYRSTPWRRKWQPTLVYLPGKSHGQEPGGLQSMGSRRVGHNLATKPPPPQLHSLSGWPHPLLTLNAISKFIPQVSCLSWASYSSHTHTHQWMHMCIRIYICVYVCVYMCVYIYFFSFIDLNRPLTLSKSLTKFLFIPLLHQTSPSSVISAPPSLILKPKSWESRLISLAHLSPMSVNPINSMFRPRIWVHRHCHHIHSGPSHHPTSPGLL